MRLYHKNDNCFIIEHQLAESNKVLDNKAVYVLKVGVHITHGTQPRTKNQSCVGPNRGGGGGASFMLAIRNKFVVSKYSMK